MPKMKMSDWLEQAREFPTLGEAERYRVANGIEIEDTGSDTGELPPVSGGGALSTVTETADDGNVDVTEETQTPGGLDLATLDFSQIKSNPEAFFKTLVDANLAAEQRAAASAKKLYDAGRQRIMAKYAGPSQSERLFALSKAMLSPTDFPGFKGFLGNVVGALGENAQAARKAEQTREEQLFALQQQYQQGEAARLAARPKTALELASKYITATKAPAKSSVSPIMVGSDLRPRIRATGAEFKEPPQDQIYALQAYMNDPANTPENKMITRRNFDKTYGYGAAAIYLGE